MPRPTPSALAKRQCSTEKHYATKQRFVEPKIDTAVYELYGLTEEEIKVVEGE